MSSTQRLVYVSPKLCALDLGASDWQFRPLEQLVPHLDPARPLAVLVVPVKSAVLAASPKTIDSALGAHFGAGHSFQYEQLGPHSFQTFAIEDALLAQLRALVPKVQVAPYAVAVRAAVQTVEAKGGRISNLLSSVSISIVVGEDPAPEKKAEPPKVDEQIVVDSLPDELLFTVIRGRELEEVRRVSASDPVRELHRTAAAARLTNPIALCSDRDVHAELQAHGFRAALLPAPEPLIALGGLDRALALRFLSAEEVARDRQRVQRRDRRIVLGVAGACAALALGYFGLSLAALSAAQKVGTDRRAQLSAETARVATLFAERYPAIAHASSLSAHEELFDLMLSLPPQVTLVSLDKTPEQLTLVVERRADAAPFGRADLEAALAASRSLREVTIREEYAGHVIRYILLARRPAPTVVFPF